MFDILRDISIVYSTIYVLILFSLLFRSRYSRRKAFTITAALMVPLMAVNVWILVTKSILVMGQMMVLTMTIPSLIVFWIISKDRGFRFIFTFCVVDTFSYWIIVFTGFLDSVFGGTGLVLFISRLILFPATAWFVCRYLREPYLEMQANVKSGWGAFSIITVIFYAQLVIGSAYPTLIFDRPDDYLMFGTVMLMMPILYVSMFFTLRNQFSLYRAQKNEERLTIQNQQMETQLENQQIIRKLYHNVKAYMNTIRALLQEGKYEEANVEIEALIGSTNVIDKYCDNAYINAALCHFVARFKEEGLPLTIKAFECPETIENYSDICVMLFNALDNAFECVSKLNESNPYTSVHIKQNGAYLCLRIRNGCDPAMTVAKGTLPESKKDGKGHGIGLKTIVETANRLGGDAICYAENGVFTLDISVKL